MFYLMSWVREKLEKKHINNERRSAGEGRRRGKNLVWGSSANRSEGPFEVDCFSTVNSLRTCVISECKASLDFFLPENAKYLRVSHCGPWKAVRAAREKASVCDQQTLLWLETCCSPLRSDPKGCINSRLLPFYIILEEECSQSETFSQIWTPLTSALLPGPKGANTCAAMISGPPNGSSFAACESSWPLQS